MFVLDWKSIFYEEAKESTAWDRIYMHRAIFHTKPMRCIYDKWDKIFIGTNEDSSSSNWLFHDSLS